MPEGFNPWLRSTAVVPIVYILSPSMRAMQQGISHHLNLVQVKEQEKTRTMTPEVRSSRRSIEEDGAPKRER